MIAAGIASIARSFDMYTVASRVEHPQDAQVLAQLGFDCLQGFLFGAPSVSPSWKAEEKNKAKAVKKNKAVA